MSSLLTLLIIKAASARLRPKRTRHTSLNLQGTQQQKENSVPPQLSVRSASASSWRKVDMEQSSVGPFLVAV